jgi:hypothetical protein
VGVYVGEVTQVLMFSSAFEEALARSLSPICGINLGASAEKINYAEQKAKMAVDDAMAIDKNEMADHPEKDAVWLL